MRDGGGKIKKEYAEEVKEKLEEIRKKPDKLLTECEIKANHQKDFSTVHVDKKILKKGRVYFYWDEINEVKKLVDERRLEEGISIGFHEDGGKLKLVIR